MSRRDVKIKLCFTRHVCSLVYKSYRYNRNYRRNNPVLALLVYIYFAIAVIFLSK